MFILIMLLSISRRTTTPLHGSSRIFLLPFVFLFVTTTRICDHRRYSAMAEYDLPDLSPASWAKLYQQMTQDDVLRAKYISNYRNKAAFSCDAKCQNTIMEETVWTADNNTGVEMKGMREGGREEGSEMIGDERRREEEGKRTKA